MRIALIRTFYTGDKASLKAKLSAKSWEKDEQKGAESASEDVIENLAVLNIEYERRHGFIFLIFATGKTAAEMLDALRVRINNDSDTEVSYRCIYAGVQC